MDISRLGRVSAGQAKSKVRAGNGADPATQVFRNPDKRVARQREALTTVQLSGTGKLQASLSDTQAAARTLGNSRQIDSDAGVKKAAGDFVAAFNNSAQAAKSAVSRQESLADSNRARTAEIDVRRAVSADATVRSELKEAGITQQKDGTLAIDTKKFDTALKADPDKLRDTLANIGQRVDRAATRELAEGGNPGNSVDALGQRARSQESQQADQAAQAAQAAAQQAAATQNPRLDNTLNDGAAAYQKIFSI